MEFRETIKRHLHLSGNAFSYYIALAILFTGMTLTGCQPRQTTYSGFLNDYSKLRPNPEVEDALYFQAPSVSLADYNRFIIEPIQIYFAPDAKGVSLEPAKLDELTAYTHDQFVAALSKRYQVISTPGPGVLRIHAAITDIKKTEPLLNINPGTKLSGIGLGGASMEAEAIDTTTEQRVFAVVDTRQGNRLSIQEGLHEMGHPKQVIDHWIDRFIRRLDVAHGHTMD